MMNSHMLYGVTWKHAYINVIGSIIMHTTCDDGYGNKFFNLPES